jgi:hypothetical protein
MPLPLPVGINFDDDAFNRNCTVLTGKEQSLLYQVFSFAKWYPIDHAIYSPNASNLRKSF